jgi:hypothetical protein
MKRWIVKILVLGAFLLGWSATQHHLMRVDWAGKRRLHLI